MVMISPLILDRWQAWDDFVETTPEAGFMQSSWWAEFRAQFGYDHFGVVLKSGGVVLGGAMVMRFCLSPEQCFYYIQDGPVLPRDDDAAEQIFAAILEEIKARRRSDDLLVSHLRIEPRWKSMPWFVSGFRTVRDGLDRFFEPRNTLCIDLRPSEETVLARMKPKGRYNIHVAQRHGVSVVEDTSETGLEDFLRIYDDTADRQGFGAKPREYFGGLLALNDPVDRVSLFFAEYQGVRLAAAAVVVFGRRATYFYGGSLADERHVMAPYLLHFEVMRAAKARGCEWYDLWGIAPENDPYHPWQRISVLKRKFGGVDLNLVPTLDHVYDGAAYDNYLLSEREKKRTPPS